MLLQQGDTAGAIDVFKRAIASDPYAMDIQRATDHYHLGCALRQQDDIDG